MMNVLYMTKKNDFLWFMDHDHLSVEASKNLSIYFDKWIKNKYQ